MVGSRKIFTTDVVGARRVVPLLMLFIFFCISAFARDDGRDPLMSAIDMDGFNKGISTDVQWSQNPFVKPASGVAVDELKLRGIVYSKADAAAVIGSQVVRAGDKLGYNDVVQIDKSFVILRNENGLFRLALTAEDQ